MAYNATGLVGLGPAPAVKSATAVMNNNTVTVVAAVPGKCITPIQITASAAVAVTLIELKDGSTVKWHACTIAGPASATAPAGAFVFKGTANTVLNCTATTAGLAYVSVTYIEEDPS